MNLVKSKIEKELLFWNSNSHQLRMLIRVILNNKNILILKKLSNSINNRFWNSKSINFNWVKIINILKALFILNDQNEWFY